MAGAEETLNEVLSTLPEKLTLWNVAYILALIVGCILACKLVLLAVGRLLARSKLDRSLHNIVKTAIRAVLALVCILLIADSLGIPITSLVALFSVVGLALSLAVQGVLANLAGGIMLLWAKPFQVGDFVEVDGIMGTVKETGLMYTKLDTTDNRLVYLTNKVVSEAKVVNFSGEETRRVELTISASYGAPIEEVKAAIREVIGTHPKTLPTPEPVVGVIEYGESAIRYNVWFWCAGKDYWEVLYSVNEGIKRAFDEKGLEMTYNHLNVHMMQAEK